MYRIVYTKQAPKDKEKLKASGLDKKAKELIEQNCGRNPLPLNKV